MPDHWQHLTLGDVLTHRPGKYLKKDDYAAGGQFAVYGSNSVMGSHGEALFDGPLVVMAGIGAYAGAVRLSKVPCWVNNNAFAIFAREGTDIEWLYLWLDYALDLGLVRKATAQPYIDKSALVVHPVVLPSVDEQRRIVDLIGSIDTYIDGLEGQIDATRTARAGMLSEMLSNPVDDWQETTLGDLASWSSGKSLPASKRLSSGVFPVFGASTEIGRTNDWLIDFDAVLVGRVGAVGAIQRASGPVWVSDNALIAKPNACVEVDFLRVLLEQFDFSPIVSGNAQPVITQGRLKSQRASLPPLSQQRRIVDLIGSIDKQISSLESQVESVRALRSGLLSELLSGERLLDDSYDMAVGL